MSPPDEHDEDPEGDATPGSSAGSGPPPPGERIWRHPSELAGSSVPGSVPGVPAAMFGSTAPGGPQSPRRTSNFTALAGTALSVLLVALGAAWLTRPVPSGGPTHAPLGNGVSASLVAGNTSSTVASTPLTTLAVPGAVAAHPLSTPVSLASAGRMHMAVTEADTDSDGTIEGALVVSVWPGGRAEQSGLRSGDVIVAVGHTSISRVADLGAALAETQPGQAATIRVLRDDRTLDLALVLAG